MRSLPAAESLGWCVRTAAGVLAGIILLYLKASP